MLSLAYSVSGGAYTYLIKNQDIKASNGPLPATFRVGFAASDGGASNVHEIMCFKAAPSTQSGSSATVNEKEAAKVEAGTQAYFAFYNPDNWTGTVTANTLLEQRRRGQRGHHRQLGRRVPAERYRRRFTDGSSAERWMRQDQYRRAHQRKPGPGRVASC